MLNILASHNPDIQRLIDRGYAVSLDSKCLVIRDIPYLDQAKALQKGSLLSKLVYVTHEKVQLEDHQVFFCGSHPCEMDGRPIANLGGGLASFRLQAPDLKVERSFSNKPPNGYADLYEKIETYVNIIAGPAISLYPVDPYTFRTMEDVSTSVFNFHDTLTSRAEIGDLNQHYQDDVIAIIGLGGTGAYVLDFLAKTPVREIRGFDGDVFHAHTAFRSPGRQELEELGKAKADVYQRRYEPFRKGISIKPSYIVADSVNELAGVTFAFVCVDKGTARQEICSLLIALKIPFIDVGIGLARNQGPISGTIRSTYFEPDKAKQRMEQGLVPLTDLPNDVYRTNIQIAELNALNACLALMRYKQIRGFYADDTRYYQHLFNLDNFQSVGEA